MICIKNENRRKANKEKLYPKKMNKETMSRIQQSEEMKV